MLFYIRLGEHESYRFGLRWDKRLNVLTPRLMTLKVILRHASTILNIRPSNSIFPEHGVQLGV